MEGLQSRYHRSVTEEEVKQALEQFSERLVDKYPQDIRKAIKSGRYFQRMTQREK